MPDAISADLAIHDNVRHETLDDINLKLILRTGVVLGALVVVSALLMLWMFRWLFAEEKQRYKELPPLAAKERLFFPGDLHRIPGPLLQKSEQEDMEKMRQLENAMLNSAEGGIVPIAEAVQRMADPEFAAKHGIRVRSAAEIARFKALDAPRMPAKEGKR